MKGGGGLASLSRKIVVGGKQAVCVCVCGRGGRNLVPGLSFTVELALRLDRRASILFGADLFFFMAGHRTFQPDSRRPVLRLLVNYACSP